MLKAKGFSLNASTIEQGVNFDTFKNIVTAVYKQEEPETKEIEFVSKIRLNGETKRIFSKTEIMTFQYTFNKRIVDFQNVSGLFSKDRISTIPLKI